MRPRRAVLLTPPLQTSAFRKTRLSPFLATHPKDRPVSPLLATHPKTASRKLFVCHTYEPPPGGLCAFLRRQTGNGQSKIPILSGRRTHLRAPPIRPIARAIAQCNNGQVLRNKAASSGV